MMKPESPVSPVLCGQNKQRNNNSLSSSNPKRRRSSRLSLSDRLVIEARTVVENGIIPSDNKELRPTENSGPFSGLPTEVTRLFAQHRGIKDFYDWQKTCLIQSEISESRNLILSLPTSGGKTLIAEILILRQILIEQKDAILILPFVSIVHEKVNSLLPFGLALDFLVEEYAGSKGRFPPIKRRKKQSLYVCTIEKAQSLVNCLIENGQLQNVGLAVVDEIHMLGEGSGRGATLEQTVSKIMFVAPRCRIVGMSATLSNIHDLQTFLNADLFSSDFRPVKLREFVKLGNEIREMKPEVATGENILHSSVRQLHPPTNPNDPDGLLDLISEMIPHSSCLVFCPTKKNAQNVGVLLAKLLPRELKQHRTEEKLALLRGLREECESNICPDLERCLPYGVAYHHSGLTSEERKLIQDAFLEGTLCVICCTSTLAAGVNLPARRVIIRSPFVGTSMLTRQNYKQMAGRAGRAGLDSCGESITILQKNNSIQFIQRNAGGFELCHSKLGAESAKGIRSLLLSLFALKVTKSRKEAKLFLRSTLLGVQSEQLKVDVEILVDSCLSELLRMKLVKENGAEMETTALGRAAYKGPIDVEMVNVLHEDLLACMKTGLVLATHLHLICCVVPYDSEETVPDWDLFYREFCSLSPEERKVMEIQGLTEGFLVQRLTGATTKTDPKTTRLYLALILNHLWKQERIWDVAARFGLPRGWVQNLLHTAASFACSVSRFCEELTELWPFQSLLPDFAKQLANCREMELIPLMAIQGVKRGRARQLYAAGYKTLGVIAQADSEDIVKKIEHVSKKQARQIVTSAKMLLEEELAAQFEKMAELLNPSDSSDMNF